MRVRTGVMIPWKIRGVGGAFYHYIDQNKHVPTMKYVHTHKGNFKIIGVDKELKEITVAIDHNQR